MLAKNFALIGGTAMILMGAISIVPGLEGGHSSLPELKVNLSYGLFMHEFPMNIFSKLALILFGVAGLSVFRFKEPDYAIIYSRLVFIFMGALTILGVLPKTETLGGYWPLFGKEVLSHGILALMGGYCGFVASSSHRRPMHI